MEKEKWFKSPEMIVALTALFIGLLTSVISIYSAYIDRAYAKASVWPKIEIARSYRDNRFGYIVANKGTGPAIIKYAKVSSGNKFIKRWSELPEFKSIIQSHIGTITIPSGKTISPLEYQGNSSAEILKLDENIQIELCYCSIYGDCWIVNRSNSVNVVKQCSADPDQVFEQ